ncbi:MAG: fatty acid desaturase family protein [Acidimicrobiia bacterium]|nr:fatty acid desaturase family protein [Acidimicrobiia bacterium]
MAATMVPPAAHLPDVLPTERLTATGMPVAAVRGDLRRVDDLRNVGSVVLCWAQAALIVGAAVWIAHPLGYLAAAIAMGATFARFAILAHEAAHKLLFSNKAWNDRVGRWLLAYPAFVPLDAYRRSHFAHHKEEFGPNEPDMGLYVGYPISRASFRRKLLRDAVGISGWKNLKPLLTALTKPTSRPLATRILGTQLVLLGAATAAGRPELYLGLWLLPWMTSWRVVNRLRAVAEHGGMEHSTDRRRTTHHVRQSWLARATIVPFNTGWHLAHHVDTGVPWRNLPAMHHELVAARWVTPDLEHPSYRALWRALAAGA